MASAAERRRRAVALCAALVAAALLLLPAAEALAADRVCAARVVVRASPGGFTVGYLFRGNRVTVARRSANRRWARVNTPTDLRGWITARSLCRR